MDILLVEPDYNNKYPPMSLMKISTFHKNLGDYVYFYKGKYTASKLWDRIYITTLFTFDYDLTVETINHYKAHVDNPDDIFVGGIMASIMTEKLRQETGLKNIISGRLVSSKLLGFDDNINIDELPLDYDILYDIPSKYRAGDNFFGYTTRGCINRCKFCAVPDLEGELKVTNNIYNQIQTIRETYSDKRNLLLLDNNVLGLPVNELEVIVDDLVRAGFSNTPNYRYPLEMDTLIRSYYRHIEDGRNPGRVVDELHALFSKLQEKARSKKHRFLIEKAVDKIGTEYIDEIECILDNVDLLKEVETKITRRPLLQRFVDFNQGMDARQLTEEKMLILQRLPINPFRIAYDSVNYTDIYIKALRLANQYGVSKFSNYLLYNFDDKPEDLYFRMEVNISLSEEFGKHIYSFPMLYTPITQTSRNHVGKNWNAHYLKNVRAILNVSKGVFGGTRSFFEKAFGKNINEYYQLLAMPKDLITYRKYYEDNGVTAEWERLYNELDSHGLEKLLNHISNFNYQSTDPRLNRILSFYKIQYKREIAAKAAQDKIIRIS